MSAKIIRYRPPDHFQIVALFFEVSNVYKLWSNLNSSWTSMSDMCCTFPSAIQMYKLFNSTNMSEDWISLNFQQNFNTRNTKIQTFNVSNYKVGQNLLVNRFKQLNNKIDYLWFNESLSSFKIKCKKLFLQWHSFSIESYNYCKYYSRYSMQ